MYFFGLYFSNVHISTNIVFKNLKSLVVVVEIHVEGTVSQKLFIYIFEYFVLNFIEKELGPVSKI